MFKHPPPKENKNKNIPKHVGKASWSKALQPQVTGQIHSLVKS